MPTGVYKHKINQGFQKKHGLSDSPTYISWMSMKQRCLLPTKEHYQYYGGSGITFCERWKSFQNFLEDMGYRPKGKTLDRIDNTKGYSKENCRWSTRQEQMRNRRNNVMVTFRGETRCLAEWSKILGIKYTTLSMRLKKYKLPVEIALTRKV